MTRTRLDSAAMAATPLLRYTFLSTLLFLLVSVGPTLARSLPDPALAPDLTPRSSAGHSEGRYLGPEGAVLPFHTDEQVLAFLHTATVVKEKQLDSGLNKPLKLTLEKDGIRANAIFRTVERSFGGGRSDRPDPHRARDSYVFEVAAYKVSRALGLDRVPPVVLRSHNGRRGSLQLWVENAMTEADLLASHRAYESPARRQVQKEVMRVFDQLVSNWDRHQGNSLYDAYGRLWYIDHTRTFRSLPNQQGLDKIAVCDSELFSGLKALDRKVMREELSPYLDLMQIEAMMRRRDKIVSHLEKLIEERGRLAVLFDVEERSNDGVRAARNEITLTILENALRPDPKPAV